MVPDRHTVHTQVMLVIIITIKRATLTVTLGALWALRGLSAWADWDWLRLRSMVLWILDTEMAMEGTGGTSAGRGPEGISIRGRSLSACLPHRVHFCLSNCMQTSPQSGTFSPSGLAQAGCQCSPGRNRPLASGLQCAHHPRHQPGACQSTGWAAGPLDPACGGWAACLERVGLSSAGREPGFAKEQMPSSLS